MEPSEVEALTREWITVWTNGDPRAYPLSDDFQHSSPFGTVEGRQRYLDWVIPLAAENVAALTIEDVLVSGMQSVIRYRQEQPGGAVMNACDWLQFDNGKLARVWSYYERPR